MRVLIVGAGAVGQVFGHHLALGGAKVTFLVRPKYAAQCRSGLTLYPLNQRRAPPVRFENFDVITSPEDARGVAWDQVYLAVPSTALREGDWIAPLGAATGNATIVFLPPNLDDRARVTAVIDPERLVDGMIGFLSYAAPLPGETGFDRPGMAYWFPPASPSPFSGTPTRAIAVVDALRRGGLPAKRRSDIAGGLAFMNAILYAYLATLEVAQWSLATMRSGTYLARAASAAREAMAVAGASLGRGVPWHMRALTWGPLMRIGLRVAPWVVPLPLEAYLRAHFTKIGGQVRLGLHGFVDLADERGLPRAALRDLTAALGPGASA